jgi:hypothetical protein
MDPDPDPQHCSVLKVFPYLKCVDLPANNFIFLGERVHGSADNLCQDAGAF